MIWAFFIEFLIKIMDFISQFLPIWSIPDIVITSITIIYIDVLSLQHHFPVKTLFLAFSIIIGFELTILTVRTTISLINFIRGSGELKI